MDTTYDIVIIGSGAGGGTLAYGLRGSGARVLLVERGDFLPQEEENWQVDSVFFAGRYRARETWFDGEGAPFSPGVHYVVGGNTKVYGAALPRFRREDFLAREHPAGISPAWPVSYEELEPYYARAEFVYRVHGRQGADPTEPPRGGRYPFPEVPSEPYIAELADKLRAQGLHPFPLPLGIDLREGGACIRCKTCDGFPCRVHAKSEADICCVRPALAEGVELLTRTIARRLLPDESGRQVSGVELERDGEVFTVRAGIYVVACGATNSPALLLRSACDVWPTGAANSSGLVGRNYMVHNNTAIMAVNPMWRNTSVFQKTLAVNDFYFDGPGWPYPLGNIQLLGKLQAGMLTADIPGLPRSEQQKIADHSIDWWVMSEDLPDPENRIVARPDGSIAVHWRPNNMESHQRLVALAEEMLRSAGYPEVLTRPMGIATNSHQCGTLRFGDDPATSVLDPLCRSHDIANLYAVDASFFPSSAAMNPALTIAAQALRVAEHFAAT